MKIFNKVFLILALALSSSAFAGWDVSGSKFNLEKLGGVRAGIATPAGSEVDLVGMSTASLGFSVGDAHPAYGYSVAYDLILAKVTPGDVAGKANLSPIFGIGGAFFVDAGPAINSNFADPLLLDAGVNVIGPEIGPVVPGAQLVWNLQTGEKKGLVNGSIPLDLFNGVDIFKILGF